MQIVGKPPVRLAAYWQGTLAGEVIGRDPAQGASRIAAAVPPAEAQQSAGGTPEAWAQESFEIAKTVVYGFPPDAAAGKHRFPPGRGEAEACAEADLYRVGPEYETRALATIKQQLAKAGIRLTGVLRAGFK